MALIRSYTSVARHFAKPRSRGKTAADLPHVSGPLADSTVPTPVKTGNYTASPGDFVPVDVSGVSVTITLPTAPADNSVVSVKLVKQSPATANTVTAQCGGADVFDIAGGPTTTTLSLLFQADTFVYEAAAAIWYRPSNDMPLALAQSQIVPMPMSATYMTLFQWLMTNQTDTDSPFGMIAGTQTYGTSPPVQGPAAWFGYNPALLSGSVSNASNGAAGMSMFGDAGDSNDGSGHHGVEMNPACFVTPNGLKGTNAVEMVAMNDNTNTVGLALRCGTGIVNGAASTIALENADSSAVFAIMGQYIGVIFYSLVTALKGLVVGTGSNLTADAKGPFLYIPNITGPPTGTPTAETGASPICYDVTSQKIWVYDSGTSSWKSTALS